MLVRPFVGKPKIGRFSVIVWDVVQWGLASRPGPNFGAFLVVLRAQRTAAALAIYGEQIPET